MRKATGWKLTDGSFIEDFDEARREQEELNFLSEIKELAVEYTCSVHAEQDIVKVLRYEHRGILDLYIKYRELIDLSEYDLWKNLKE